MSTRRLSWLLVAVTGTLVAAGPAGYCNGKLVYDILKQLPEGPPFCSHLLYSTGGCTVTDTSTVVRTSCRSTTTTTSTKLVHETNTIEDATVVATNPTILVTEYTSTVLVPSGPTPTVNRRYAEAEPAPAVAAAYPTPSAILNCAKEAISSGCSSLVPPHTVTIRSTRTTRPVCTRTARETVTTTDAYTVSYYSITANPPPQITTVPGVLTTTVPAACVGPVYDSGGTVGEGNIISPQSYPNFPLTGVECCVLCWKTAGCIASAFIDSALACELLIHQNGTLPGVSRKCPKGVFDYPFTNPNSEEANIYPGPCGK